MNKHIREKIASVSFTVAIVISLAFMAVYALRIIGLAFMAAYAPRISMPQVPVIIPRIAIGIEIIAIGIEIIAILVYLWSDR